MNEQVPTEKHKGIVRRHPVWSVIVALAGLIVVLLVAGSFGGSPTPSAAPSGSAAPVAAPSTPSPSPTATLVRVRKQIVFVVTGSAPQGADITYGSDSDNRSPAGGLGFDGSGTALPWQGAIRYHPSALYYDITAQLQGNGNITCKVRLKMTEWWSDGTHASKAKTIATAHASGGYNVCDAEANNS